MKDEVHKYEGQVTNLEDQIKDLDSKLSTANAEIAAKEVLVKQHSKVAEEAVTGTRGSHHTDETTQFWHVFFFFKNFSSPFD